MPPDVSSVPLFHGQPASAWHVQTHPDLHALAKTGATPILLVSSLCRWQESWPLDAEEILLGHLLAETPFPVLPPFRHCPRQDPRQTFTVSSSIGWNALEDVLRSVHANGFKKCVILHGHPLLADWLDCGLRDLRIETGMGLYRMSLESLGLSLEEPGQRSDLDLLISQTNPSLPLLDEAREKLSQLLAKVAEHPPPPPLRT